MIPHVEVVVLSEDVDFSGHACRITQPRVDDHAPLRVDLRHLAEVVRSVEILQA